MKKFFAIFCLAMLIMPAMASADGGIFPPPNYWMQETDQKAVIFYENKTETMVVSISFQGDAKDFSWVVPTPSLPQVDKSSDELFTALEKLTMPSFDYGVMPMYERAAGVTSSAPGITVIETKKVEYYDLTVLSADDPEALTKWLNDNKYQFPKEAKYLFDDYIKNKWYFTAVKMDTVSLSEGATEQLRTGHATPLKFTFSTDKIVFPLKISSVAQYFKHPEILPMNGGMRVEEETYFGCSNKSECKDIVCPQVVGQDTPCCLGEKCVCGSSDCSMKTPSSVESKIAPAPMPYWQPNVSILLYVFADHKKDLPGFDTAYADWIKSKDIEKLATGTDGSPWMKPADDKYFLTKLSRYMDTSEMTYDLYFRDAENNKSVGGNETDVTSTLASILAYCILLCIIVMVGVLSPGGLIFIGCALLQFLTKSKVAWIVSWVLQGLVFLATLLLAGLWLIMFNDYGYGGNFVSQSSAISDKGLFITGLVALVIFLVVMVGTMVWQGIWQRRKGK